MSEQEEGSVTSSMQRGSELAASRDRRGWWRSPWFVAAVLAVFCLPLQTTTPQPGIDASWQLGLSLVHLDGIHAGSGFVFTYGPFGFLALPNIVWMPGALLWLLYTLITAFGLYFVVNRCLRGWLSAPYAIVLTVAYALVAARIADVPELATAALLLWSLTLIRPEWLSVPLPAWIPVALGAAASLQLLVKTSAGVVAFVAVFVVAVARPPRWRNLALALASSTLGLVIWWVLAGQPLSSLGDWLRYSVEETSGYSSAMAHRDGPSPATYWLLLAVVVVIMGLALWWLLRSHGVRALPFLVLFAAGVWLLVKEGFVRLDGRHLAMAFLGLALLVVAILFPRDRTAVGVVAVSLTLLVALVAFAGSVASLPQEVREVAHAPGIGVREAARVLRASVQPSYRSSQLAGSHRSITQFYGVPKGVVPGLGRRGVHVDPWDISAAWAYELRWDPLPVFQFYDAYTPVLDDLNADRLRSTNPPPAVLRSVVAIDGRFPAGESPAAMVALTCDYERVATAHGWEALLHTSPGCDKARFLARRVVASGAVLRVPKARNDGDLVVATFEYPSSAVERLQTFVLKPPREPTVEVNGRVYRFVSGTDTQLHLLRVPATIVDRSVTNGRLAVRTLAFPNAPDFVTVAFYDLPSR